MPWNGPWSRPAWSQPGDAYYLGVRNAAQRVARDDQEFSGELVRRRIYP